jgi:hypothetical protein
LGKGWGWGFQIGKFQPFELVERIEPFEPVFQKRKILPTIKPLNFKPAKRLNPNLFHAKLAKEQGRKENPFFKP